MSTTNTTTQRTEISTEERHLALDERREERLHREHTSAAISKLIRRLHSRGDCSEEVLRSLEIAEAEAATGRSFSDLSVSCPGPVDRGDNDNDGTDLMDIWTYLERKGFSPTQINKLFLAVEEAAESEHIALCGAAPERVRRIIDGAPQMVCGYPSGSTEILDDVLDELLKHRGIALP